LVASITEIVLKIPDTVWAAVIASVLTLGGVLLTNRGSNNRLISQLAHDANERENERLMELRKTVYLEAVEAISKNYMIVAQMSDLELADKEIIEVFANSSASINKVNLIGTQKTVCAMSKLSSELSRVYLMLSAKRLPLIKRKTDIKILDNMIEVSSREKDRILKMMKEFNLQGIKDERQWNVINENYGFENTQSKEFMSERDLLVEGNKKEICDYSMKCYKSLKEVGTLTANAIAAVREEMNLEFDGESFKELMEKLYRNGEECLEEFLGELKANG